MADKSNPINIERECDVTRDSWSNSNPEEELLAK